MKIPIGKSGLVIFFENRHQQVSVQRPFGFVMFALSPRDVAPFWLIR